ncbi:universal stress protein [Halorubrum sp. SS5]|uniref:universal stress protein n=1 Tax=Halorubrum sp. SS7 TaxID=2518119 RepID=UPI0010F69FEB|nr:universal stress protein [Halorubrum sp. SS7]TKX58161.1 universal stress protein [Halorubrum sp. SS7]TKX88011.1 universal stress protein [Halorubrum sp. SS5]
MFDTIVVATDGSDSVRRAVSVAVDVAARFDADVHAVYVVDAGEVESSPDTVREDLRDALDDQGRDALDRVSAAARDRDGDLGVTIEVREGRPASEIDAYARSVDADLVAMGTRGRHGENRFLIGSVAERVVRTCPIPVLTVRQLTEEDPRRTTV